MSLPKNRSTMFSHELDVGVKCRTKRGCFVEPRQDRQGDEEALRRRPGADAEGSPQRLTPRDRQAVDAIEPGAQQLMEPGEGQLHLRLDTGATEHTTARRLLVQVLQ